MSTPTEAHAPTARAGWHRPMPARSRDEHHRAATPLELMFDLVMVVAVAQAAKGLHHGLGEGHAAQAIAVYAAAFFGLWWAWMNFTWFASAYDNDDGPYRLAVFGVMVGAVIFAAGVADFGRGDLRLPVLGYVVMRVPMIGLWLRAARHDPARAACARRYAAGIAAVQLAWVAIVFAPAAVLWPGFVLLALAEMAVPAWAERAGATPWHAGHIAERYGLLTLIVLGEAVASLVLGVAAVREGSGGFDTLRAETVAGGLLLLFAMWWIYFDRPVQHLLGSLRLAFLWGYGHYLIFAAAAAVGAGLAAQIEHPGPGWFVAVPAAVYLLVLWALHVAARCVPRHEWLLAPLAAVLILLCPLLGAAWSTPAVGAVLVALLLVKGVLRR